jgi:hypothetical protein
MSDIRKVILEGISKLQLLELQDEFGSNAIQAVRNVSDLRLGALSNETVVVIIITLPIAKAIARMIVRDKAIFKYRSRRPDGTEEEATLTVTRAASIDGSEEQIVKQLIGEITQGDSGASE